MFGANIVKGSNSKIGVVLRGNIPRCPVCLFMECLRMLKHMYCCMPGKTAGYNTINIDDVKKAIELTELLIDIFSFLVCVCVSLHYERILVSISSACSVTSLLS